MTDANSTAGSVAARSPRVYPYDQWAKEQGVPIVGGHGLPSLLTLRRESWPQIGGKGTIIKLEGMQGVTSMYVAEIPPAGSLKPEQHLYEKLIYVLRGRGITEVSAPGSSQPQQFEWQEGSLFAIPLNTRHVLHNASGREPAIFAACTNAAMIMDVFHNQDFVFGTNAVFPDRYNPSADYFQSTEDRYTEPRENSGIWRTNFVPDIRNALLAPSERKGLKGNQTIQCELAEGVLVAHINEWPAGRYNKGHHHGAGAVIIGIKGTGYSLLWPAECGPWPFRNGHGDKVLQIPWDEYGIFSPPEGWYHQHFNPTGQPTRVLAFRYGSRRHPVEFHEAQSREGVLTSMREGGTMIDYEDEDPEIARIFARECAKNGVESQMPQMVAR